MAGSDCPFLPPTRGPITQPQPKENSRKTNQIGNRVTADIPSLLSLNPLLGSPLTNVCSPGDVPGVASCQNLAGYKH